jgi:two-component system chemotaxis response regulator CheY
VLRQFVSRFSPKRLCLIADSSVIIRKAAASILSDLRFHVTEAENSDQALSVFHQQKPDAILLDGMMARPDGFAFLRKFSEKRGVRQPKIILCTTERNPSEIARAINAGAHEYVIKPFDRSILTAKLEQLGLTA